MLGHKLVAEVGAVSRHLRDVPHGWTWREREREKSSGKGERVVEMEERGRSVPASSRFLPPWPASRNRFTLLRPGVSVSGGPLGGGRKGAGSGESLAGSFLGRR